LNYVLVALLVWGALSKMFSNLSPGLIVLGLIVPLYFAYAIARFDGRAYPFLILLLLLNALNVLFEKGNWRLKLSDLVWFAAVIAVAFVAQRKIFPNMRLFRVKKRADGSYIWCNQERRFAEATLRGMPPPVTARQGIPVSNRSRFLVILILMALVLFVGVSIRDAYYNRGAAKIEKGDLDGAIADYNRAIELNPKDARAYYNRGIAKRAKGDLDGAIADFSRAIELDPKYAIAYNNRGIAKDDKGDLDGAIADYNRAIELDPKHAVAYNNRGFDKEARGDLDGAIADYNRAIELDPKLAIAYNNRGNAEKKLSRSPSRSAETPSVPLASPVSPTMTPALGVNLRQVTLEAHLQFYKMHSNLLNMTRWMQVQSSVSGYKRITREDLRDFDWKARNVLDSIDQVLGYLPVSDQEPWRVRRALVSARSEQARLFEANWNEWHASGVKPKKGEAKPWQKKAIRLQSEIDEVKKRYKELKELSQKSQ
jgi:tetratricopeptide (TPR) repeat protein